MILKAKELSKVFYQGDRKIDVFKDIDLQIDKEQSLAIVGPSGSGKSTLLSILSGLESADTGTIEFDNKDISKFSEKEMADWRRHDISMVFQQFHLFPHLTVLENVMLPLELLNEPEAYSKAKDMLERVGLGERLDHLPNMISGGEAQRVAIARALVHKPKLIFADEPSGNLDTKTGQSVMNLFFELIRENKTAVILVTHNLELANQCNSVFEISNV